MPRLPTCNGDHLNPILQNAYDLSRGLLVIDVITCGVVPRHYSSPEERPSIQTMAYSPDGSRLLGAGRGLLHELNQNTGYPISTVATRGLPNVRGMVFLLIPVPEPTTLMLIAGMGLVLTSRPHKPTLTTDSSLKKNKALHGSVGPYLMRCPFEWN